MTHQINQFINEIRKYQLSNDYSGDLSYIFLGDGSGDTEEQSNYTTKECLRDYIQRCNEQIKYAKECIKNIE